MAKVTKPTVPAVPISWRAWLLEPGTWTVIAGACGVLAAIVGAGWAVYTHFEDIKLEVKYDLCVAPKQDECPLGTKWIDGLVDSAVAAWVKKDCSRYKASDISSHPRTTPAYHKYSVTCSTP
jgi:hypothetical protein